MTHRFKSLDETHEIHYIVGPRPLLENFHPTHRGGIEVTIVFVKEDYISLCRATTYHEKEELELVSEWIQSDDAKYIGSTRIGEDGKIEELFIEPV